MSHHPRVLGWIAAALLTAGVWVNTDNIAGALIMAGISVMIIAMFEMIARDK